MNALAFLILLPHDGHCFAESTARIEFCRDEAECFAASIDWLLSHGETVLARGCAELRENDCRGHVSLALPDVRTLTALRWSYTARETASGVVLGGGVETLHLYPADELRDCLALLGRWRPATYERNGTLAVTLGTAGCPVQRISDLRFLGNRTRLLIVGAGALRSRADYRTVVEDAQRGCNVLLLPQTHAPGLAEVLLFAMSMRAWPRPGAIFAWEDSALDPANDPRAARRLAAVLRELPWPTAARDAASGSMARRSAHWRQGVAQCVASFMRW